MSPLLSKLSQTTGIACTGIGIYHLFGGVRSVPGEQDAGPTVDSRERFYGAIFAGYGLAWLWVDRQKPVNRGAVQALSGIFLLGGAGRLLSRAQHGRPHWFQDALTVVEVVLPCLFFWLARVPADEPGTGGPVWESALHNASSESTLMNPGEPRHVEGEADDLKRP